MGSYILRRLVQSALTVLGVMVITFLLFRVIAGDVSASFISEKSKASQRAEWKHNYGYDRPELFNVHRRLEIIDRTTGTSPLSMRDVRGSRLADALAMFPANKDDLAEATPLDGQPPARMLIGRYARWLKPDDAIAQIAAGHPAKSTAAAPATATAPSSQPASAPDGPAIQFTLTDGSTLIVPTDNLTTVGQLMDRIRSTSGNDGRLVARLSQWSVADLLDSQFFHHLKNSVTFNTRSLKDNRPLLQIIRDHAPYSLAITVPAMVLGWLLDLALASLVAYYRGRAIDHIVVFLSVIGMCVPILAFMMYGQYLMFQLWPRHAYGVFYPVNVYVPIAIMVVAGLGPSVRFYRTVILDETSRDYVRTARAKGVSGPGIMFRHVLRNCMLPILTSLVMSIPFLIMGNLLMETYFGIPGLGDLMVTSINERNEPILNGLVFLLSLVYTLGVLITDLSYAVFDPRIRLQ